VPPLALMREGRVDERIVALFRINSRTPDTIVGDLLAQVAACTTGALRLAELDARIGTQRFEAAVEFLIRSTADRLGRRIASLGACSAAFEDVLEWSQNGRDHDLPIRVRLEVRGDRLIADFAGTAAQVLGPVNATKPLTMSCLLYAIKTMLDPDLASNAGLFRHVELITHRGTLVDAEEPAAVALCTSITSQRICDALIGAFNQLVPDRAIAASTGSMNALVVGGSDEKGRRYSYVETYAGGQGALRSMDGADAVHTHMTNTANSPVELIERSYPMTVLEYAVLPATGGAGRRRGGHGITRSIRVERPSTVTVHLDRTRNHPWGLQGGAPGSLASAVLERSGQCESIPGKTTISVAAGTIIRIATAGGGGFGPPGERPEASTEADRREGLMPRAP
jgi:N-methylhydantoinase B